MKASELRIGNYYDQFGNYHQVSWPVIKDLCNTTPDQFWCKPIPITEEWLLRFGFEKDEFHDNYVIETKYGFNSIKYIKEESEWLYNNDRSDAWCHSLTGIKHVHQLQNLYFALTGKELCVESEVQ